MSIGKGTSFYYLLKDLNTQTDTWPKYMHAYKIYNIANTLFCKIVLNKITCGKVTLLDILSILQRSGIVHVI